jgi:hypothetical protein
MDYKRHFRAEIERSYPKHFTVIGAEIEARYQAIYPDIAFARKSSNPVDRRLEFCGYFLATIQALEARGSSLEEIQTICVRIAEASVQPTSSWHRWLKGLPGKLMGTPLTRIAARIMQAKAGKKGHPDGFLVQIITAPDETYGLGYGIDILECGICKLFSKHGALVYVPILCEIDRLTTTMAGLEMLRGGTIALGAEKCDFRYRILKSGGQR